MLTFSEVFALACLHAKVTSSPMRSSALKCIDDAHACLCAGDDNAARRWAVRSLAYSVGILHPDFIRANATLATVLS